MNQDTRLALLKDIFTAFVERGDVAPLLAAVTDDVSFCLTVLPGTPLSGEFKGKAGMEAYFARNAETVETSEFEVTNYLAGGNQIAVVGRETLKVIRSGEVHRGSSWVTLVDFRGDKIERVLVVEDTAIISAAYPGSSPSSVAAT
jgi:ketosteroid isomerase-like protein